MGAEISSLIFQPLLLLVAAVLIIVALVYQKKKATCNGKDNEYGAEVFKLNMGLAATVVAIAVIIDFLTSLMI